MVQCTETGNQEKVSCFLRPFLSDADRKTRKEITGISMEVCQIFPALRSKDIGKKYHRRVGRITTPPAGETSGSPHRGSRHFLRARFYHSAKIRVNAHFCPAGILLGLPPQTRLFAACAALKNPSKNFCRFFKKHFRLCPCFSPISERAKHKKKGVEAHEKIQHAPPQPGNQDTLDRGRIRRVFRARHPLPNEPV